MDFQGTSGIRFQKTEKSLPNRMVAMISGKGNFMYGARCTVEQLKDSPRSHQSAVTLFKDDTNFRVSIFTQNHLRVSSQNRKRPRNLQQDPHSSSNLLRCLLVRYHSIFDGNWDVVTSQSTVDHSDYPP